MSAALFLSLSLSFYKLFSLSTNSLVLMECRVQASRARLFKEYKEVQREKSADPDIQLVCDDSNIFKWTALIKVQSKFMDSILIFLCCFLTWCLLYTGTIRDSLWRWCFPACFLCSWAISFAASSSPVLNQNISSKCTFQGINIPNLCSFSLN